MPISDPTKTNNESTPTEEGSDGANKEAKQESSDIKNGLTPPLGGIWLHRQAEDDEVIDYGDLGQMEDDDDDDRTTFSEDSIPSTPLPQLQDLALFDPLATGLCWIQAIQTNLDLTLCRVRIYLKILYSNFLSIHHESKVIM